MIRHLLATLRRYLTWHHLRRKYKARRLELALKTPRDREQQGAA